MSYLPDVRVKTIVIFDKRGELLPWSVAQGKFSTYFGIKDTIELNMDKIVKLERSDLVAEQMVRQWLLVKVLIDTREDLEGRRIREHLPGAYEKLVYETNLRVIYETPHLKRHYTNMAIEQILNVDWLVDDTYGRAYADLSKLLRYWLDASTDIENLRDKVYLGSLLQAKKKGRVDKKQEEPEEEEYEPVEDWPEEEEEVELPEPQPSEELDRREEL